MKKTIIAILLICTCSSVWANPISFTSGTVGTFSSGTNEIIKSDGSIIFSSKPDEISVSLNPGEKSNITLGVFQGFAAPNSLNFYDEPFTLSLAIPDNPSFKGILSGTITQGASNSFVVWDNPSLTFLHNGHSYTLTLEERTPINAPSSPDMSRIRGQILLNKGQEVPEPVSLFTLGTGMAGIAALLKKKKKKD